MFHVLQWILLRISDELHIGQRALRVDQKNLLHGVTVVLRREWPSACRTSWSKLEPLPDTCRVKPVCASKLHFNRWVIRKADGTHWWFDNIVTSTSSDHFAINHLLLDNTVLFHTGSEKLLSGIPESRLRLVIFHLMFFATRRAWCGGLATLGRPNDRERTRFVLSIRTWWCRFHT